MAMALYNVSIHKQAPHPIHWQPLEEDAAKHESANPNSIILKRLN
jgi:hypothetical protein